MIPDLHLALKGIAVVRKRDGVTGHVSEVGEAFTPGVPFPYKTLVTVHLDDGMTVGPGDLDWFHDMFRPAPATWKKRRDMPMNARDLAEKDPAATGGRGRPMTLPYTRDARGHRCFTWQGRRFRAYWMQLGHEWVVVELNTGTDVPIDYRRRWRLQNWRAVEQRFGERSGR